MNLGTSILLAFDFGLARIGVATGNLLTGTANPVATLAAGTRLPWSDIDRVVDEWQPGRIVVGMPSTDASNPLVQRITSFADQLRQRYGLPVETVDESHTSVEAAEILREERAGGTRRRRVSRETIDRHAACLIAIRWMQNARTDASQQCHNRC